MDTKFYKIVRPVVKFLVKVLFRVEVVGIDNIPKDGGVVLAGNHTKWLDPVMLVGVCPRQVHFLAKDTLFKGIVGVIVKGMGAIPVNRRIHDKNALKEAEKRLNNNIVVGVFPEGTINRTKDIIMPFKIGAVKMSYDTSSKLVPFVITGKYKLFRKSIKIEFLRSRKISGDLTLENKKLEDIISKKLEA
ncbi:MAG: 1-acyl-sn-glycerol-3-phosphate acyltransferase [Firmicutes bacterium]|nr:1-acyl-sn-glycerol-3-phosphate acyltransferase [Bacillota bacterium]